MRRVVNVGGAHHAEAFAALRASSTALLTTFRSGGQAVATPVSITLDADRAYFVTASDTGKARRLATDPRVTLAPCTVGGSVVGETVSGRAQPLPDRARGRRRRLLRPTRALFWSYLRYRLQGKTMIVYEVAPASDAAAAP